ncbi:MAG: DUF1016 family protein [Bacteroidales bacterium]|nr:DUF1016 family protein [Bacteroidales bacterium]
MENKGLKPVGIIDDDYLRWVKEISSRYRKGQIKAAMKVNQEMLRFYWELGRDIVERNAENKYGSRFYAALSKDLKNLIGNEKGLSARNLMYAKNLYLLYYSSSKNLQQVAANSLNNIFCIPWGHHILLIDKCHSDCTKALFYVQKTLDNGWSRNTLLNYIDADLYERSQNALTNFRRTLPEVSSDLALELAKDPYNFSFTGISGIYNERKLKDALVDNISQLLLELGTGFAYVGKEYCLHIGDNEKFIDLLFYNLKLSCYVVVEVKIGKLDFADIGQLSGYVVACNHLLRKDGRDNPTIGLLICKEKDYLIAQYALEASNQPIGISEYELAKLYPERVEGTIPSIDEIKTKLK